MNIVITGQTGYISNSLKEQFQLKENVTSVNTISIRGNIEIPKNTDILIHTAALVHKREKNYTLEDYMNINYRKTMELANYAKRQGVKHFIFFSTMAVFGVSSGVISAKTKLKPISYYGKSKLLAEEELFKLQDENFIISVIRPPMVYGPKCPGNYSLLSKLAKKILVFPKIDNKRSSIFIYNLTELTYQILSAKSSIVYHPQDPELLNTSKLVKEISRIHGGSLLMIPISGSVLSFFIQKINIFNKIFGDLAYDKDFSEFKNNSYQKYGFEQAILITELKRGLE